MPSSVMFVEVCGNCGSIVKWDEKGDPVHNCTDLSLQFIEKRRAVELGLIKEGE